MRFRTLSGNKTFEDRKITQQLDDLLLRGRGKKRVFPQKETATVLLLSGGLDSISLWYLLMHRYNLHVYPLFLENVDAPIKTKQSWRAIKYFQSVFRKKVPAYFHAVKRQDLRQHFSYRSLTDRERIIQDLSSSIPNIITDSRGTIYFSMVNNPAHFGLYIFRAFEYALKLRYTVGNIHTIFTGVVPSDSQFIRGATLNSIRSLNLSICLLSGDYSWDIVSTQEKSIDFYLTKKKLIQTMHEGRISIEKTWSCNEESLLHCGDCYNCVSRRLAFMESGLPDNTKYLRNMISADSTHHGGLFLKARHGLQRLLTNKKHTTPRGNIILHNSTLLCLSPGTSTLYYQKRYFVTHNNHNAAIYNEIGKDIFETIKQNGRISFQKLCESMINRYRASPTVVKKDTLQFVIENLHEGFISVSSEPAPR